MGVASLKLLGVAAAALEYHRGVCARVGGSLLESGATVVRGTPELDGIVEERSSVVTCGLGEEARKGNGKVAVSSVLLCG